MSIRSISDLTGNPASLSSVYKSNAASEAAVAKGTDFQNTLQKAYNEKDKEKLKEACEGFETMFLNIVLKEMRATVQRSDLIPESNAENIFQSMLDEEICKDVAKGQGVGIKTKLYDQLSLNMDNQYVSTSKNSNRTIES